MEVAIRQSCNQHKHWRCTLEHFMAAWATNPLSEKEYETGRLYILVKSQDPLYSSMKIHIWKLERTAAKGIEEVKWCRNQESSFSLFTRRMAFSYSQKHNYPNQASSQAPQE